MGAFARPNQRGFGKRNFAARDFWLDAPPMSRRDADQAWQTHYYHHKSRNVVLFCGQEITSICADFLVELGRFKPPTCTHPPANAGAASGAT
jgi:hypothetical protein